MRLEFYPDSSGIKYIFPDRKINTFILQIKTFIVFFLHISLFLHNFVSTQSIIS